jgi:hypothetical protein
MVESMAPPTRPPRALLANRDLGTDLILVLPVLIAYNVGLFLTGFHILNGVDFITRYAVALIGVPGYLLLNLVAALVLVVAARSARKSSSPLGRLRPAAILPVLVEAAVFALLMGGVIVTLMRAPFRLQIATLGPADRFVGSLGAGFFEETVFRLGLLNLIYWVAARGLRIASIPAWVIAILGSSAAFSAVHYVGFGADPFALNSFVYRLLAGAYLAGVYRLRGFAVAVYTHAFYDLHVLLF